VDGAVEPHLEIDPVLDVWALNALGRLAGLAGVHRVGLAVVEGGGRRLRFTASDRASGAVARWCLVDAYDDVPLNRAIRTGAAVMGTLTQLRPTYAAFVEAQGGTPTRSIAAVPITAAAQALGGFVLFYDEPPDSSVAFVKGLLTHGGRLGQELRMAQRQRARDLDDWVGDMAPEAKEARHDIPLDPAAVGEARSFLRQTLKGWGAEEDCIETAVLCLSELVTNAVVHGSGRCSVRVSEESGVITVAVRDAGTRDAGARGVGPTGGGEADPLAVHGRGLRLVDALARRWGSDLRATGLTVWFVLDDSVLGGS
jgi:anti-sigma regulatory factor (Ser/Thr protein kinase)